MHLSIVLLPTIAVSLAAETISINVGKGGLVFSPNAVIAAAGDVIEFHFFGSSHTVVQGDFSTPCRRGSGGFGSGPINNKADGTPNVFQVTVQDTNPMWFYCSTPSHCQSGMVGVVNPPSSGKSLASYQSAAGGTSMSEVSALNGGVVVPLGNAPSPSTSIPQSSTIPPTLSIIPPTSSIIPPTSSIVPPTSSIIPQTSSTVPQKSSDTLPASPTSFTSSSGTADSSSSTTVSTTPSGSATSAVSAPSAITTAQTAADGRLSTGAKAGIGIGVVLAVIMALLVAWVCLRRRKRDHERRVQHDAEIIKAPSTNGGHEMMTTSNAHEMASKPAVNDRVEKVNDPISRKTEELDGRGLSSTLLEMGSTNEKATTRKVLYSEMQTPSNTHEMATSTNIGSDWENLSPSELYSQPIHSLTPGAISSSQQHLARVPVATRLQNNEQLMEQGSSSTTPAPSSEINNSEERLEVLRKRIDRVREDKQRLEKIQELKDLEAELQREILVEQRRAMG